MLVSRSASNVLAARRGRRDVAICCNAASLEAKHVLIIGGTGRVGSSTASALLALNGGLKVTLASRNRSSYDAGRPLIYTC